MTWAVIVRPYDWARFGVWDDGVGFDDANPYTVLSRDTQDWSPIVRPYDWQSFGVWDDGVAVDGSASVVWAAA
jgi:hypothetical protein